MSQIIEGWGWVEASRTITKGEITDLPPKTLVALGDSIEIGKPNVRIAVRVIRREWRSDQGGLLISASQWPGRYS